ncbi:TPA: hypothetical protein ACHTOO_001378 [Pseudomonas aeruginosa]
MTLLRFLGLIFVLVSLLAGSAAPGALLVLTLRFWPLLVAIGLALLLLQCFICWSGVRLTRHT